MLLLVYQTSLNYVEKNKFSIIWFDVFFLFAPVIYHLYSKKKKWIRIKRNSIVLPSSECGALYLNQIA
jgi:hypothetical protein